MTLTGTLNLTGNLTLTGTMTGTLTATLTHRVLVGGSYGAPDYLFQIVLGMGHVPDEEWELGAWGLIYELGFLGIILSTV